jgi:hypothetical protein
VRKPLSGQLGRQLANSKVVGSQVSMVWGMQAAVHIDTVCKESFRAAGWTAGQQQGGGQPGEHGVGMHARCCCARNYC